MVCTKRHVHFCKCSACVHTSPAQRWFWDGQIRVCFVCIGVAPNFGAHKGTHAILCIPLWKSVPVIWIKTQSTFVPGEWGLMDAVKTQKIEIKKNIKGRHPDLRYVRSAYKNKWNLSYNRVCLDNVYVGCRQLCYCLQMEVKGIHCMHVGLIIMWKNIYVQVGNCCPRHEHLEIVSEPSGKKNNSTQKSRRWHSSLHTNTNLLCPAMLNPQWLLVLKSQV